MKVKRSTERERFKIQEGEGRIPVAEGQRRGALLALCAGASA